MTYFAWLLILLNVGAGVCALFSKQPYKAGYWFSAATITYCAMKM